MKRLKNLSLNEKLLIAMLVVSIILISLSHERMIKGLKRAVDRYFPQSIESIK